jgi:hypothetical protein
MDFFFGLGVECGDGDEQDSGVCGVGQWQIPVHSLYCASIHSILYGNDVWEDRTR